MPQIEINSLKKSFSKTTVVNIDNFTINDGEIIGLVGNNGAGKTTLFRMILDLLCPDSGEVIITSPNNERINPKESEDWKDFTGAFIDESGLIDFLTAEEYFEFIGKIGGLSKEETSQKVAYFNEFMNNEVIGTGKLIRNLSAGNKQKVGIIGAMILDPKILILDEPFNFLDPSSQTQLKHLLQDFSKDNEAIIIISSHNLQHTIDISTRIALMEHGIILKDLDNHDKMAENELEEYFGK